MSQSVTVRRPIDDDPAQIDISTPHTNSCLNCVHQMAWIQDKYTDCSTQYSVLKDNLQCDNFVGLPGCWKGIDQKTCQECN